MISVDEMLGFLGEFFGARKRRRSAEARPSSWRNSAREVTGGELADGVHTICAEVQKRRTSERFSILAFGDAVWTKARVERECRARVAVADVIDLASVQPGEIIEIRGDPRDVVFLNRDAFYEPKAGVFVCVKCGGTPTDHAVSGCGVAP